MPTDLSLAELSALAAVPTRTIRYYLAQGLLPAPGREGPSTRYPVAALHRLRLIRQLQRAHLPLAEIRRRLAAMSDDEVEGLVDEALETAPADSALEYVRGVLATRTVATPPDVLAPRAPGALLRSMAAPSDASAAVPSAPEPSATDPSASSASVSMRRASAAAAPPPAPETAVPSIPVPTATALAVPERSQWERIVLEPDVELHVRRPSSRIANRRVDRLVAFARQLLEEDQP